MRWALLCALAACGRVGFDPVGPPVDGGGDGSMITAPGLIVASGAGDEEFNDLAIDGAGHVVLAGRYTMNVNLGTPSATAPAMNGDGFIAVVEPDGATRFLTTFGATGIGVALATAWLPDGDSVTTGYFNGTATRLGSPVVNGSQDAIVTTLDALGAVKRLAHFGGNSNTQGRAIDASGSRVIHGGIYMDTFDLGSGSVTTATADNAYLASTDLVGGNPIVQTFNGNGDVYINDIALVPDGSICVAGRFTATTSFGGPNVSPNVRSVFVARFEPNLALRWVTTFGRIAEGNAVGVADNGDCLAAGQYLDTLAPLDPIVAQGPSDAWVARFAAGTGAVTWLRELVGPGSEYIWGVVGTPDGRIVLSGVSEAVARLAGVPLANDGGTDGFLAGMSGAGEVMWVQHIGGSGGVNAGIAGVAVDPTGTYGGAAFGFTGELTFDGTTVTATGDDAAAIVIALPQ